MRDKTTEPPRCDACQSADDPRENAVVAGHAVVRCLNPTTCRLRAQRTGIWGRT